MNHFFSLIKKALFLFWDKKFFSKKKKKKHANLGIFGHFLHSVKRRGRIFLYIGSKIYTRIPPIILPTRFFRFFKKKFFSIFFLKNGSKIRSFFNNSRILIKNDFYCCFSILNMILLSKMTFCHFWGYPFLQKLAKIDISLIIDRLP